MDKLPQEIFMRIASFLTRTLGESDGMPGVDEQTTLVRPAIASVSRRWQDTIEALTFRNLRVNQTELTAFSSVLSSARRRRLLRTLGFDVLLPTYSDELCAEYETDREREINGEVASDAVSRLLHELAIWPGDLNMTLYIDMYSPMDELHRGNEKWEQDQSAAMVGTRKDLFSERYRYSYIRLTGIPQLQVPCVGSFYFLQETRPLNPASMVSVTSVFPNLTRVSWTYEDAVPFAALRKQLRDDFSVALERFECPPRADSLDIEIQLNYIHPYHKRLPDLRGSCQNDPLGIALNNLISRSNLRQFKYEGPIDPSFFWPAVSDEPRSGWSSIENITVKFPGTSPSGRWYLRGSKDDELDDPTAEEWYFPPGYGTEADTKAALAFARTMERKVDSDGVADERDRRRWFPDDAVMNPLLEAFARRLASMPSLESAVLQMIIESNSFMYFVEYGGERLASFYEEYTADSDPVLLRSRPHFYFYFNGWVPKERVVDLFRVVGKERYGHDALVTSLPCPD